MLKKRLSAIILLIAFCVSLLSYQNVYASDNYHLQYKSVTMYTGESAGLALLNSSGKTVNKKCKWYTKNKKAFGKGTFSTKSSSIFFTPHKKGKYTITCTCNGKTYKCRVRVKSFLKKTDKKVLYHYTNSKGELIQLVRVKNHTSSVKCISTYLYKYDLYNPWNAVKGGKYAYFRVNKTLNERIDISRPNVNIKGTDNIRMTKNRTSKVKCSVAVNDDNTYTVKMKNSSSYYVHAEYTCVLFNKDGEAVYIASASNSLNPKESTQLTYLIDEDGEIGATNAKIYYNAASY